MKDSIIAEIRKTRDEYAHQFNYDLHAMCLDLRREQQLSEGKLVSFVKPSVQRLPTQHDLPTQQQPETGKD